MPKPSQVKPERRDAFIRKAVEMFDKMAAEPIGVGRLFHRGKVIMVTWTSRPETPADAKAKAESTTE